MKFDLKKKKELEDLLSSPDVEIKRAIRVLKLNKCVRKRREGLI